MSRVYLPVKLDELHGCLADHPGAALFAGGTDLFVKMRADKTEPKTLIGLERIAGLRDIREDGNEISIGACSTHARLLDHPLIARHLPVLRQALATLGSPAIREMGTIGGNICTASPAGDTLPPLYVLQARVEIASPVGTRLCPISDFIAGPGKTNLHDGEIVTAVRIARPAGVYLHHFEKVGQRKSMACAVASLAALIRLSPAGHVESCRLAWGSVGPTVVTDGGIEKFLIGKKLTRGTLTAAASLAEGIVNPIGDIRASAAYRRTVSGNLLLRLAQAGL